MSTLTEDHLRDSRAAGNFDGISQISAVSWGAILLGAIGAAGLSLILLILGSGLGLLSVSPWAGRGASAAAVGVAAIAWLSFTQFAASSVGGYLAGRLRVRWTGTDTDEVYFRDTAHGFAAWCLATLITAALLTTTLAGILGTGARAGATVAAGAATAAAAGAGAAASDGGTAGAPTGGGTPTSWNLDYYVDSLLRQPAGTSAPQPSASAASAPVPGGGSNVAGLVFKYQPRPAASSTADTGQASTAAPELSRIFATGMRAGALTPEDTSYLGQVISTRTGLPQADAERRVTQTFAKMRAAADQARQSAREAADKARVASAKATLWFFVSLLIGAFVASYCGMLGGKLRDRQPI